jgi:hypothetical protein
VTSDKYLIVIGLSEEDEAHLRLLMRRAAIDHLSHMWRWGSEDKADLMIIDPATFAGQMARNRAFNSGKRCAVYGNEELREHEVRLARPMKLEAVADLLNEVGAASEFEGAAEIIPHTQNFYELDDLPAVDVDGEIELNLESGAQREARPAQGLDDLLKPELAAAKPVFAVPLDLKENITIEGGIHHSTARREKRQADARTEIRRLDRGPTEINLSAPTVSQPTTPQLPSTLRDYLRGNLLGGPATLALPNCPALTLDPKSRVFHSTSSSLQALVPYCKQALPRRDWHALTTAELARVRETQPAQPYSRLIWLATLVQSGGRLAAHLDPGGRYKLKDSVQPETELPTHARIGKVMRDMAKLNEIAAVSGASMTEVFDVINAYEAIHALETERRQPRHTESDSGGLLSKLRKSIVGR